jgi:hypothetical protein
MFARKVSMHLKNDGAQAFKQKIENEIVSRSDEDPGLRG